jgi:phosphoglucosamine mutase
VGRSFFGTDGVRGVVGDNLTPQLVEKLGKAFALWSSGMAALVGRDTRASGPELEAALARGLADGGSDVVLGGVLPTPAVALLADEAGAVVSASHNPPEYNGVKFFVEGLKLTDAQEEEVEGLLDEPAARRGTVTPAPGLADRYVEQICERFGGPLTGLRVAVDCANGAMSEVGPEAFRRLGADIISLAVEPDGHNINVGCGATDLSLVARCAREEQVDLGIAFDGDGDRMLAVDADGREVDGDQIVAILALVLGVDLVAVTKMTNLGFHQLMAERGIRVVTTDVGDRYVLEALLREGGTLGGEQSGHIIMLDGHRSGDGLAAALVLCRALVESGRSLAETAAVMSKWPQVKANIPLGSRRLSAVVQERVDELNARLDGRGRVLVRPSGTEPVVRVLAEAESEEEARDLCGSIARLIQSEVG